jgi:hypothetical protein
VHTNNNHNYNSNTNYNFNPTSRFCMRGTTAFSRVYWKMKDPSEFSLMVKIAFIVLTSFYVLIGSLGFFAFYGNLHSNVIDNFSTYGKTAFYSLQLLVSSYVTYIITHIDVIFHLNYQQLSNVMNKNRWPLLVYLG